MLVRRCRLSSFQPWGIGTSDTLDSTHTKRPSAVKSIRPLSFSYCDTIQSLAFVSMKKWLRAVFSLLPIVRASLTLTFLQTPGPLASRTALFLLRPAFQLGWTSLTVLIQYRQKGAF